MATSPTKAAVKDDEALITDNLAPLVGVGLDGGELEVPFAICVVLVVVVETPKVDVQFVVGRPSQGSAVGMMPKLASAVQVTIDLATYTSGKRTR
jgi:hypothetical protein